MKTLTMQFNSNMKQYTKYICAFLLLVGVNVSAWGTHPGGDYTLITAASSLSEGDAVILYDDANNVGVTGTSGTSATFCGVADKDNWIEYTVAKPNSSTLTLADWSILTAPKIYADEDGNKYKFTYSTSSGSSFGINSNGNLTIGTTRLAHDGEYIRFYGSAGTALKVYKVGHPKTYEPTCDGNLCINPDKLFMAGEWDGDPDVEAEFDSELFTVTTQYGSKNHYVYVECDEDKLTFVIYDYDYDEAFGSSGYYTPSAGTDISRLKVKCWAKKTGTFSATLHAYAYNVDGAGTHKHVTIPITITVIEKERDCTPIAITRAGSPAGTVSNGSFTVSPSSQCENEIVTLTPTPSTGYELSAWTITKTSNGDDVTEDVLVGNEFIMPDYGVTVNATFTAKIYAVGLDDEDATTAVDPDGVLTTYNSNVLSDVITNPEKNGYTFAGWWSENNGTGNEVINTSGALNANVEGFTGASGIWIKDADVTLYAKWVPHTHKLTVGSPENVTITATPAGGSAITEGNSNAAVDYGKSITLAYSSITSGYTWSGWQVTKDEDGTDVTTSVVDGNTLTMPDYDVTVTANVFTYTDYVFSCAELTLTPHLVTASTPIFITSTASKKVRSQDYITITGSGLTPSTALTFPGLDSKFEVLTGTGGTISTDASGAIDVNAYIFYTPAAESTGDGLDKMAGISVSVGGAKPKQVTLIQEIIGRHLPTDFVIAAKSTTTNKWYALPANMSGTGNPEPVEIAVDDINNPTIAYTAASNVYNLYLSADKEKVQLGMKNNVDGSSKSYALWANNAASSTDIGKNTGLAENTLGDNYKWTLTQTNTSITNPQDAKYTISNLNNVNPLKSWFAAGGGPKWGLYANGVAELRLIPASDVVFTEAYFVEWGQHGGVIEVDAQGVDATSVVAHLGEATSSAITLVQTKASDAKNKSSKYNYTVNFGDAIDFAAAASNGAMLTLEWKNGATVKAMSNIIVPKIIATSATMSSINSSDLPWSQWEVHVLPGVTLTANAGNFASNDVIIKHLEIYQGATVEVTKGAAGSGILTATTLVLRNGWSRAGVKTYDVARLFVTPSSATLKATNVYADWYIDYDQYYPVAVPWNATVANFTYRYCSVSPTVGHDKNIRLRYYDGASRATNVQEGVGNGANWKLYGDAGCASIPTTLTPSTGYAMTAKRPSGKAFSIIRMPLTLPSGTWGEGSWTTSGEAGTIGEAPSDVHKDQVTVTAHNTGSTPSYAQGWNLIANPYMSLHQGAITYTGSGTAVTYVNIPDVDFKEYDQQPAATAKLKPASAFLIQAPETGTITFGTANRKASTPSFRVEENPESVPEQQAYIVLNNEQSEDMMGILVSDKYTAEYELNADLEKLLGDGTSLKTYMHYGDMNMAYVAINEVLAREWIPVTVRIPESGEYTYSLHEASIAGELEGIYLIDYQNGDHVTNLIDESYSFTAEAGTINGRFAINAIVGQRETPTDIDIINAGGDIHSKKPVKFIWNDKVFILHRGVIYDSTGKRVREINR